MGTSALRSRHLLVLLCLWGCQAPCYAQALPSWPGVQASAQALYRPASERPAQVNTVAVFCHHDFMEIVVKADMFEVGAPISGDELWLGVEHDDFCRAATVSEDELRIVVGLSDCGTKHWMNDDALIYTNLLMYSPVASLDGLIRMEEAVIPIECHYGRKYSLSSASLTPTWIQYTSTQAAVETLDFNFRIMTSDWLYERSSNIFYLGEPICMEASVRVGHHMGLRVFMNRCVATLYPDRHSVPRYVFIENDGCLIDSQLQGSHSQFLPRTQDDKLRLVIDAFRFHQEERGELYITCELTAAPLTMAAEPQNKACTSINGRWRSADGHDYLCGYCGDQNEAAQTLSKTSSYSALHPRSRGKPEASWKGGQEASLGPMLVLPAKKSGIIPDDEIPSILSKIGRPMFHGSEWRSGMTVKSGSGVTVKTDLEKGLVPEPLLPSPEAGDITDLTQEGLKSKPKVTDDAAKAHESVASASESTDNAKKLAAPEVLSLKAKADVSASDVHPTAHEDKRAEVAMTTAEETTDNSSNEIAPKK